MEIKSKSKIIAIIILIFLILAIPLTLILTRRSQEIRKKAFGTGQINIVISPSGDSHQKGSIFTASVNLVNTNTERLIYTAGVDIQFDTNALEISVVNCNTGNFSVNFIHEVIGNTIKLSCFRSGGQAPLTLSPNQSIVLGTFQIKVKDTAPLGKTSLTVLRGVIPDANNPDLSNRPNPTEYTITEASSTPGNPTPTTGPISPTISPTPACTPSNGNADKNPAITLNDFEFWREGKANADFNCQNGLGADDFLIWKQYYLAH